MANLGGKEVEVDEGGYLINHEDWNKEVAGDLAKSVNVELTPEHWKVIDFLQEKHKEGVEMSLRKIGKSGVIDIKSLYKLFPGGPLKNAAKVAGLERPTSCV